MIIGIITRGLSNGGAEHVIAQLSEIWSSLGHQIVFITSERPSDSEYHYTCHKRLIMSFSDITDCKVGRIVDEYGVDLVVFNDGWNNQNFENAVDSFKYRGIKIICILHHTFTNWMFTLSCARELEYHDILRKVDLIVAVEPLTALWWRLAGANSTCIPNPISIKTGEFSGYKPSKKLIWIGRLSDFGKRVELAISAFCAIAEKHSDCELEIFGSYNEALKKKLLVGIDNDLVKRIKFFGFHPNIKEYLSQASILLFTSLTEACPQVIGEAQALGIPSLVFDMPTLVEYDRSVGVVRVNTYDEFVLELDRLIEDVGSLKDLSANAIRYALDRESTDRVAEQWSSVFEVIDNEVLFTGFLERSDNRLKTPKIYGALFSELRQGFSMFAKLYMPDLMNYRKWRTRFSSGYICSKLLKLLHISN